MIIKGIIYKGISAIFIENINDTIHVTSECREFIHSNTVGNADSVSVRKDAK